MDKQPCVYILASRKHGTLYTGVTTDLAGRVYQHRTGAFSGFTADHGVTRLMWFEIHDDIEAAIVREKRIKGWRRDWKIELIESSNPDWNDLAVGVLGFEPLPCEPLPLRHPGESRDPRTRGWK
jgi:putative endonuclease